VIAFFLLCSLVHTRRGGSCAHATSKTQPSCTDAEGDRVNGGEREEEREGGRDEMKREVMRGMRQHHNSDDGGIE
jgi:hypothetical protein